MPLELGTIGAIVKAVIPVAKPLIAKINSAFHPDDFEKALKAGIMAAREWDEKQPYEQQLFFHCDDKQQRDILTGFFQNASVLSELQKPLQEKTSPNLDLLIEIWHRIKAENPQWQLSENSIDNWLKQFIETYFVKTTAYLNIKIAQVDYLQQISYYFDDVKFAGIAVEGQETDKTGINLPQIFVMPDVVEMTSTNYLQDLGFLESGANSQNINQRQAELLQAQRQLRRLGEGTGRKFSAQELLTESKSHKFVLLGAPGSGKTTLMSYFAVTLAQNQIQARANFQTEDNFLPVVIRIRDLVRYADSLSILEFIRQFAISNLQVKQIPPEFFEYWLEDGKVLILLDGLDEVANPGRRYEIVQRIENFLKQFPSNRTIITSRPAGYRRDFFRTDEFPHYQLQLFDDDKIKEFTEKWYESRFQDPMEATRRQESLQKALAEQNRIQELARNPLLLTIIALIHRYEAHLPRQRYKLYERAMNTLLTNWDAGKELNYKLPFEYLNRDDIPRLMQQLAYWIHTQGSTGDKEGGTLIDKDELIKQLSKFIAEQKRLQRHQAKSEAQRVVEHIRERTGLLNEQGQDCYAFVHKTFQEYLAAEDIRYRQEDEEFEVVLEHIEKYLCDAHWREVLLLLIAQQKPRKATKAIKHILEQSTPYEQWLHRNLFFAASCLAEDLEVANDVLVTDILQQLVGLEISDVEQVGEKIRVQVFNSICSLDESRFEAEALQLLKDSRERIEQVRLEEYRVALGEKEEVTKTLLARLGDEDSDVRENAAHALRNLGNGTPQVIEALLELLKNEDFEVRWNAFSVLGNLGNGTPQVVEVLLELLKNEDSRMRWGAVYALDNLGNGTPQVVEVLLELLKNEDSRMRWGAANILGKLGNGTPQVVEVLLELLKNEDSLVRWGAANTLGNLGNGTPQVVEVLLKQLKDENSDVRWITVHTLGNLGNGTPQVVEALLELLKDEDSLVRLSAAYALGNLGNGTPQIVEGLLEQLKDEDSHVRWGAAHVLGNLGNGTPQVVEVLLELLKNEDSHVRWGAAHALGNLGNGTPQVVEVLLELLKNEDSDVRWGTVNALGKLGKNCSDITTAVVEWISQHQDREYVGSGIDALWNLVATDDLH
ncbi:MAG: HEAT repeat domain-containing protein [Calothrix sp. MO_192.B10]|nr:HEAT repeat domain-containing protein [Calothrix sp. MO_192.B10]